MFDSYKIRFPCIFLVKCFAPLWNPIQQTGKYIANMNCSTGGWVEPINSFFGYIIKKSQHIMMFAKVTSTCLQEDVNRSVTTLKRVNHQISINSRWRWTYPTSMTLCVWAYLSSEQTAHHPTSDGSLSSKNSSELFLSQNYEFWWLLCLICLLYQIHHEPSCNQKVTNGAVSQ